MGRKKTTIETGETQRLLMNAAINMIGTKGIEGATARAIADQAGVNQALIFYHFGSVNKLLIAAVDDMSKIRLNQYKTALDDALSVEDLLKVAFDVFSQDRHSPGYVVLSQMVSAAQSDIEIAEALGPMFDQFIVLVKQSLERVIGNNSLPIDLNDIAIIVVSVFLGVRLLGSLPKYNGEIDRMMENFEALTPMMNMLLTMFGSKSN